MPRWMGVDLGTRRIGLSLSDPKGTIATPYLTLDRSNDELDAQAVFEIARGEKVTEIVVGHPLMLDGTRGDAAMVTEAFVEKLKGFGAKVKLFDERLTTKEASKKMRSVGVKARKQKSRIDKAAATVLLQSYLDQRKR